MAPHSSILAWKILWAEEPRGLQSMGPQLIRHTERLNTHARVHTHTHTHTPGLRGFKLMDAFQAISQVIRIRPTVCQALPW